MKTLVVVSGGDAPGINPALLAYAKLADASGDTVMAAVGGFAGLFADQWIALTPHRLLPHQGQGGTLIDTSREPVLSADGAAARLKALLSEQHVDNLLLFGGDGSLRYILPLLAGWGVRCVGIPTTIDNDIPGTEQTLGFDSACNFAYRAIDGVLATARALRGRIFTVETLGGTTGFIALAVAQAGGAHAVLIPEYAYDDRWLAARILSAIERDTYALVLHAEGIEDSRVLPQKIRAATGIRVRDTRLGHGQRGTAPSHQDRVLAVRMAYLAYTALRDGAVLGVAVVRGEQVLLHEGALDDQPPRVPDRGVYERVNGLRTSI
ncbi:MAG: 6-phosphofructokinase [Chloroflexi bacterium]|nr:6-phosphofructokinase [Chloroflexota bacterium]